MAAPFHVAPHQGEPMAHRPPYLVLVERGIDRPSGGSNSSLHGRAGGCIAVSGESGSSGWPVVAFRDFR
jgi:hypothetical protein